MKKSQKDLQEYTLNFDDFYSTPGVINIIYILHFVFYGCKTSFYSLPCFIELKKLKITMQYLAIPPNVCAYLTFAYGLSRPDEHKTFSFENVRALAVKRRPYANVAEQFKSNLKSKLSFTKNPEKRKYHCEAGAPEGREPDTRC